MLQELISRTNHPDFYHDFDLKLSAIQGTMEWAKNQLSLQLDIVETNPLPGSTHKEQWTLTAYDVLEQRNLFQPIYLPYVKFALLDDHPLLWKYHFDQVEVRISGHCQSVTALIGAIHLTFKKWTGGWIDWQWEVSGIHHINDRPKIESSMSLRSYQIFRELLGKFGLTIEVTNVISGESKGIYNRPKARLMLLGNTDVSPHDHDTKQPYLIADQFTAEKEVPSGT
ncbi:hypothetical protein [Flavilitoribacter nigricans]|uniref:Uncharacterized protein n=1 Tax=Flavilitoribacter nigricans (strain ATCC 23147 / DSM 23189 / NBRC 102662 / NCIMB 1420 / SS-2) TaxID=1122177 RepID=A0A2D0N5B1_FLAN2|nr:hypothetical protein [Flavilitoribacter nigricans]PHN03627.1 hypothetical protein CRP01_25550 [Flavilitoribacter nigricans DSM 23189 = NBRC 102662]